MLLQQNAIIIAYFIWLTSCAVLVLHSNIIWYIEFPTKAWPTVNVKPTVPGICSRKAGCWCWWLKGKVGIIRCRGWWRHVWHVLWLSSLWSVRLRRNIHLMKQHTKYICQLVLPKHTTTHTTSCKTVCSNEHIAIILYTATIFTCPQAVGFQYIVDIWEVIFTIFGK